MSKQQKEGKEREHAKEYFSEGFHGFRDRRPDSGFFHF
jgi:hypothetical protein